MCVLYNTIEGGMDPGFSADPIGGRDEWF